MNKTTNKQRTADKKATWDALKRDYQDDPYMMNFTVSGNINADDVYWYCPNIPEFE
jgi:hypothetical protein